MASGRLIATLLAGGLALLAAGFAFAGSAKAAGPYDRPSPYPSNSPSRSYGGPQEQPPAGPWRYTDRPQAASTGRAVMLYIDEQFSEQERQGILSAIKQWNHVLNGLVQFQARLIRDDSPNMVQQIRRSGGWIVAKVDSRHPAARGDGTGRPGQALALTSGGRNGGFVYVIGDRVADKNFTAVMMHELGHVLGGAHNDHGLMAPYYSGTPCIDRNAVSLIAQARRLPLEHMNWCEMQGADPRFEPRSAQNSRSRAALNGWR